MSGGGGGDMVVAFGRLVRGEVGREGGECGGGVVDIFYSKHWWGTCVGRVWA